MKHILISLPIWLAATQACFADDVMVSVTEKSIPDAPQTVKAKDSDILDIHVGISPDSVKKILVDQGYQVEENKFSLANSVNIGTTTYNFPPYLAKMYGKKDNQASEETIEVTFSNQMQRNKSITVKRVISYQNYDQRPKMHVVFNAAIDKYGMPSYFSKNSRHACWVYYDGELQEKADCGKGRNSISIGLAYNMDDSNNAEMVSFEVSNLAEVESNKRSAQRLYDQTVAKAEDEVEKARPGAPKM